jgi:hypothetical protein
LLVDIEDRESRKKERNPGSRMVVGNFGRLALISDLALTPIEV